MATSGSKTLEFDVSDYIEEAFERCGLEARTGYDARTARRSLNLLLLDWANRGINRWTIDQEVLPITTGTDEYLLGAETIDLLGVMLRQNGNDTPLTRNSREDWLAIYDKSTQSTPTQYYVDRQLAPTIRVWPVPDQDYELVYDRMVRMDDVTTSGQSVEVPFRFYPALAAGLAYMIALKRAPDRVQLLQPLYEDELRRAQDEDRDRASFWILPPRGYSRL